MSYTPKILKPEKKSLVETLLSQSCVVYTHEELSGPKFTERLVDRIFAVNYDDKNYPIGGTVLNHHSRQGCYEVDSEKKELIFHQGRLTPTYDIRKLRGNSFVYKGSIEEALKEFKEAGFRVSESALK